jgi:hypothetical protein
MTPRPENEGISHDVFENKELNKSLDGISHDLIENKGRENRPMGNIPRCY